jgi:hypothetical protein
MLGRLRILLTSIVVVLTLVFYRGSATSAEDNVWSVSKSSGEVWLDSSGVQPVSLSEHATLKAGDNIRTGRNGRVLLIRGNESILISPNSIVGLPLEKKEGPSTTIIQRTGSILIEVEKRNEKHFEVETPYLVAVVKGTQFRVSVTKLETHVDVFRGNVEVADLKSGQYASVLPGQRAKVSNEGRGGLSLSGSGSLNPIQQGIPRAPSVPAATPKIDTTDARKGSTQQVRISAPLGEVNLDVKKATKGIARAAAVSHSSRDDNAAAKDTVWGAPALSTGNGVGQESNGGNSGGNGGGNNGSNSGNGNGNGYGHASCGNGKGKGKGNSC